MMRINGATLGSEESLAFNGSDEIGRHFQYLRRRGQ